jgi:hypothetical protein
LDKKALLATGVISARLAGGSVCFVLTARGEKTFALRTGESAALEGGEDGALVVAASDVTLETEETDWCRGTVAGRLERNP